MGFLGKALRSGVALQAVRIAQREMAKPENQRRAKELLHKVTNRGGSGRSSRP
jgi:hypothetical protein